MSKPQRADNVLEDGKVLNAKNDLAEEEKKNRATRFLCYDTLELFVRALESFTSQKQI